MGFSEAPYVVAEDLDLPNMVVLTLGWGSGVVGHVLIAPNPSLRSGLLACKGAKA